MDDSLPSDRWCGLGYAAPLPGPQLDEELSINRVHSPCIEIAVDACVQESTALCLSRACSSDVTCETQSDLNPAVEYMRSMFCLVITLFGY